MGAQGKERSELAAKSAELSPRRLMLLTGVLVAAIGLLFLGKISEEREGRRIETALRVAAAASDCAAAANVALMTGDPVAKILSACAPSPRAAAFLLSADGDILAESGATKSTRFEPVDAQGLKLSERGKSELLLKTGRAALAWRPLDNGETILVAAPAADLFERSPPWLFYLVVLTAVSLAISSLMGAFIRQSQAASKAAAAVVALQSLDGALAAGRTGAWTFDPKDRSVKISRSLLDAIGLGARDRSFSLREITALVHPEDLRGALSVITGDTSGVTDAAVRLRHPTGGWRRILFRTTLDATRFSRSGVAIDLSGSTYAAPSAAIAEIRLKDAIESIPEAFVLWDGQGRLVAWNRRFSSVFRINPNLLQAGLSASAVVEMANVGADVLKNFIAPNSPIAESNIEVDVGEDRWLNVARRRTAEGGLVCVASNVTDQKRRARAQKKKERQLEATVNDLETSRRDLSESMRNYQIEKNRAEDASRTKSEFLASMSHELRTPLNAINGFSEIMLSELYGPLGDGKYKEYVSDILSSGQHLLELIDDILDMSRIEAGKLQLESVRIDLEKLLEESARLVAKRARDAGVTLTVSVGHAPAIYADARATKQVVLNLLSNAIKFTAPGGEVTLTAEADLDGVGVIVADNGCGIAKDNLGRLGAPFETTNIEFARPIKGAGLGLALSKSLVEMQGGILALASTEGRGTVACAVLPRRRNARVRLPQFMRADAHVLTEPAAFANAEKRVEAAE